MRILYIITGLRYGGAEKLLYHTCKYLCKMQGVQIDLFYFDPYAPLLPLFKPLGIKTQLIKRDLLLMLRLMLHIRRGKYDIVHTHLIHADIWGRLAAFLTTHSRTTAIFSTAHGTEWFRWQKGFYLTMVRSADRFLSLPRRSQIIAISQSVRKMLLDKEGILPDKIYLLYNAIEFPEHMLPRRQNPKQSGLKLLFVGRLSPEKNISCLLRAFAFIRDLRVSLTIVGEGKLEGSLREMIKSMDLEDSVELLGATLNTNYFYATHDIFILPSTSEGLGIVILEAFSHEMPVIGSDVDGISELLDDDRGLLFESDNSEQLACKIRLLCKDHCLRSILGQNGLSYAKKHHGIQEYVIKLYSVYQKALEDL